jgi:hypothetical protein
MLDAIKNFDARRASVEELVETSAEARAIEAEFKALGIDQPDWLEPAVKSLRREIATRTADAREAKLRDLRARRSSLRSESEKREDLDREIAALEDLGAGK